MDEKFCVRLRRERERLGLTQKEFADKVGVSRMSQVNYESGKRFPGEEYFDAVRGIGADDYYLIFGFRMADMSYEAYAARFLLGEIAHALCLDERAFNGALEEMTHLASQSLALDDTSRMTVPGAGHVADALLDSPVILDASLLGEVLTEVESMASKLGLSMSARRKAEAVTMLYRSFRACSGKIDKAVIAQAVTLAST